MGVGVPAAHGEVFNLFTSQLSLDRGDFRTVAFAGDFSVHVAPRWDVSLGLGYDGSNIASDFRDWEDDNGNPIEQTTQLRRLPVNLNLRYYLTNPGRRISTHAWVPVRFTPYLTAGGGLMFYKLVQDGDFVDFQTLDIFSRRFTSSGNGGMLNAGAGAEWWLNPRVGINAEGRYAWASAKLERDFDFDHIDLRGFQVTTGLAVRF